MRQQLQGIALIFIGFQLTIVSLTELPWFPVITGVAEVLIPMLAFAANVIGLIFVFKGKDS